MNCATEKGELITFASGFLNQGKGFGYRVSSTGRRYQIWKLEQTGNNLRIKALEMIYHSDHHVDAAHEWQALTGANYKLNERSLNTLVNEARGLY